MDTKDQEKIYKLYESFYNIRQDQTGDLNYMPDSQHPNLSTTNVWGGINGKKMDRYTPSEDNESSFKYKDKNGEIFKLIEMKGEKAFFRHLKTGTIIEYPLDKISTFLKEI